MSAIKSAVILALLFYTGSNIMAQQTGPTRKDLMIAMMNQKVSVVEIKEITMPPGAVAPKHMHPCPVVGYVISGSVLFQVEGEKPTILQEGAAFHEQKNKILLHFDNASKDKPLKFIAFYLKERDEANTTVISD